MGNATGDVMAYVLRSFLMAVLIGAIVVGAGLFVCGGLGGMALGG